MGLNVILFVTFGSMSRFIGVWQLLLFYRGAAVDVTHGLLLMEIKTAAAAEPTTTPSSIYQTSRNEKCLLEPIPI